LELLDQLDPKIAELTAAVEQEANQRPEVLLLMTHPGVGPITGLVYDLLPLETDSASHAQERRQPRDGSHARMRHQQQHLGPLIGFLLDRCC